MRKISIGCMLITVALFSCTNDSNNIQYQAVLNSLNSSNKFIENSSELIYETFDERLKDPPYRRKAELWQPKAKGVKKIADSAVLYINQLNEELKMLLGASIKAEGEKINLDDKNSVEQLFFKNGKAIEIADRMSRIKDGMINLMVPEEFVESPNFRQVLQVEKQRLKKDLPINDIRNQYLDYFKNLNVLGAMVILAKIKNDVLNAEYLMIKFFLDQTPVFICGFNSFSAIINQNTTVLRSGDKIEIFGGIGSFSSQAKPRFIINGQVIKSDDAGVTFYELKINQAPGNYSIPVRLEFTTEDGREEVLIKNIKYQVLK